jgi:hypothetical protein
MGLHEGSGNLTKATKTLMRIWAETRVVWNDAIADAFEKEHLLPLELAVRNALGAIDHMGNLLSQAKGDCQ